MKKMLYVLFVLILLIAAAFLYAFITGRDARTYPVLLPSDSIEIGQKNVTTADLAQKYLPILKISSSTFSPPLLAFKYDVVSSGDNVDILYYFVWQDEIHPNPIVHRLYYLFRAVYYGIPVRDIEYFQITIDRKTGDVEKLRFETTPGTDYYVNLSEHLIAEYTRNTDSTFSRTLINKSSGEIISQEANSLVDFQDLHVFVGVATWNHLSRLISASDSTYNQELKADLQFLSDQDYKNGKYARKSQGTHVTKEGLQGDLLGGLLSLIFFIVSGYLVYHALFGRKN